MPKKKQQKVRGSRRQRQTSDVKSGEAGRGGGGGWKMDAKNGWFQLVAMQRGGLGGGLFELTPKTPGPVASADLCCQFCVHLANQGSSHLGQQVERGCPLLR